MFKSRLWILFNFILLISCLEVQSQMQKKCANFDEYCQTHSDCCSRSCLTYLYRCTRNYNGIYPYTMFGEKYPVQGTLDDVIDFTMNSVSTVEQMQNRRLQQTQQEAAQPMGLNSRFGGEIVRGNNYPQGSKVVSKFGAEQTEATNEIKTSTNAPPQTPSEAIENVTLESRKPETDGDCKAVGVKCFRNDECCTKLCHGFLHQCVT